MRQLRDYPDSDLRIFERPILPDSKLISTVHLIGVCGIGMGSLAGLFKEAGYSVTGSDKAAYPPMNHRLAELGIPIIEGFAEENLSPLPDLVIVGNACTPTHVEAAYARDHRLVQASFPEALARYFIQDRNSIVVAGTHGKTTTTSMLTHVFKTAGLDPGFLIGGIMNDGGKSFSTGSGDYFLVEGDEYDSSYFDKRPKFLHYQPRAAIVTSVEFDHADIYSNHEEYQDAFREFIRLIPADGLLALNVDDPATLELAEIATSSVVTYGLNNASLTVRNVIASRDGQSFEVVSDGQILGTFELSMSGRHNLQNALAVVAIALDTEIPLEVIKSGLKSFLGVQRRQQILGEQGGVIVIDDFAHHPTAVGATIESIRERFPERRIVAVFEPRSNSSRRKVFENGYAEALSHADAAFLCSPPFRHNDDVTNFMSIDTVLASLHRSGIHGFSAESADSLLEPLLEFLAPGDVALVMSNGGFGNIHRRILASLQGDDQESSL
ncbi:MAG: UDP-N-acetylmuramate--L-alanine ligase [Bacteroidetes bacterium]|nr:MAG: UDP-N-acetylmuramate--L-alanine ligase [Bacteroidota bacterium]